MSKWCVSLIQLIQTVQYTHWLFGKNTATPTTKLCTFNLKNYEWRLGRLDIIGTGSSPGRLMASIHLVHTLDIMKLLSPLKVIPTLSPSAIIYPCSVPLSMTINPHEFCDPRTHVWLFSHWGEWRSEYLNPLSLSVGVVGSICYSFWSSRWWREKHIFKIDISYIKRDSIR